ncbi:MAG: hypothetical protein KF744_04175 [Taibaiella sp.]|nr:hypothetical protein [Taibaiella sp.]
MSKIFEFQNKKAAKALTPTLSDGICTYTFSCLWSPGKNLSLGVLVGRRVGDTQWQPIITNPKTDIDGEITVQVGSFPKGTKLELAFDIFPMEDIAACAVFITNITENVHKKLMPADGNKQLEKGKGWRDHFILVLF